MNIDYDYPTQSILIHIITLDKIKMIVKYPYITYIKSLECYPIEGLLQNRVAGYREIPNGVNFITNEVYPIIYQYDLKSRLSKSLRTELFRKYPNFIELEIEPYLQIERDIGLRLHRWYNIQVNDLNEPCMDYQVNSFEELEPPSGLDILDLFNILCYDIETSYDISKKETYQKMGRDRISSIVYGNSTFTHFITWSEKITEYSKYTDITIFKSELEMLIHFVETILPQYDMIYGYNNHLFDDIEVKLRYEKLSTHSYPKDMVSYDLLQEVKTTHPSLKSYKLDDVLEFYKLPGKNDMSYSDLNFIFNQFHPTGEITSDFERVIQYNKMDVVRTIQLEGEIRGIDKYIELSGLSGERLVYLFKNANKSILPYIYLHLPSTIFIHNENEKEKYKGADNIIGKHIFSRNIYPYDFGSLYPSMIISYNLCSTTILHMDEYLQYNRSDYFEFNISDNETTRFLKPTIKMGIVPRLMRVLWDKRNTYKRLHKTTGELRYKHYQNAIKVIMNSIYGKYGESRMGYVSIAYLQIANTITHLSRTNNRYMRNILMGDLTDITTSPRIDETWTLTDTLTEDIECVANKLKGISSFIYADTDSNYISYDRGIDDLQSNQEFGLMLEGEKYLKSIFKRATVVEFEGFITHMIIKTKKSYIFRQVHPIKDIPLNLKIKFKGLFKPSKSTQLKDNFHKEVFTDFIDGLTINNEYLYGKYLTYLPKITDTNIIQYATFKKDKLTPKSNRDALKKVQTYNTKVERSLKIKKRVRKKVYDLMKVSLDDIYRVLNITPDELGYLVSGTSYQYLQYKLNIISSNVPEKFGWIKVYKPYNIPFLDDNVSLCKIPLELVKLNGGYTLDIEYYKESLQEYITKKFSSDFKKYLNTQE